jgi:hypothetical protein
MDRCKRGSLWDRANFDEVHWSPHVAAACESIKSAEKERRERIEKSVLGKFMAEKKRNAAILESNTDEPTGSGSRHSHIPGQYSQSDEEEGTTTSSKDKYWIVH